MLDTGASRHVARQAPEGVRGGVRATSARVSGLAGSVPAEGTYDRGILRQIVVAPTAKLEADIISVAQLIRDTPVGGVLFTRGHASALCPMPGQKGQFEQVIIANQVNGVYYYYYCDCLLTKTLRTLQRASAPPCGPPGRP